MTSVPLSLERAGEIIAAMNGQPVGELPQRLVDLLTEAGVPGAPTPAPAIPEILLESETGEEEAAPFDAQGVVGVEESRLDRLEGAIGAATTDLATVLAALQRMTDRMDAGGGGDGAEQQQ